METVQLYESGRELCPRTNYENDGAPQKIQQMEAFLDELAARVAAALAEAKAYADGTYMQASGYTDLKVADLINGAPTTLDTLKEIADAMLENENVVEALEAAVGAKANEVEFQAHAGNGTTHVTSGEREKWNAAKTSIDSVCQQLDEMGAMIAQINSNLSNFFNPQSQRLDGTFTLANDSGTKIAKLKQTGLTGLYYFGGYITFSSNKNGKRRLIVTQNTISLTQMQIPASDSGVTTIPIACLTDCNDSYIEFDAYQNSGGSMDITYRLWLTKIR